MSRCEKQIVGPLRGNGYIKVDPRTHPSQSFRERVALFLT